MEDIRCPLSHPALRMNTSICLKRFRDTKNSTPACAKVKEISGGFFRLYIKQGLASRRGGGCVPPTFAGIILGAYREMVANPTEWGRPLVLAPLTSLKLWGRGGAEAALIVLAKPCRPLSAGYRTAGQSVGHFFRFFLGAVEGQRWPAARSGFRKAP